MLRSLDEVCFKPWDAQRFESRLWLLAQLWSYRTKDPTELHMRTIEAYLEAVPYERLCAARGVGSATMTQHQKDVEDIWGAPIDSLKQRFELHRQGRGAGTPAFLDDTMWAPDAGAQIDGRKPPRPRRPSARRSR